MITGAHIVLYSANAEADRAFLRDVLGLAHADAGEGWLIFRLPPGEVAVHPGDADDGHALQLLTDDVADEVARLAGMGVRCGPIVDRGWGLYTTIGLPSGGQLGLYQPRHIQP